MKDAPVTISRRAARYLAEQLRLTIESHTKPSPAMRKLKGRALVVEATAMHEADKNPTVTDDETDLQWFQRELFPLYIEVQTELTARPVAAGATQARKARKSAA